MPAPGVRVVADPLAEEADALLVVAYSDALSPLAIRADEALGGELSAMHTSREIKGRFAEVTVIPSLGRLSARRVIVLGLGDPAKLDSFRVHNAYHFAGRAARRHRCASVVADVDAVTITALAEPAGTLRAAVTGLLLANLEDVHRSEDDAPVVITSLAVAQVEGEAADVATMHDAAVLAHATNRARLWAKTPANQLTPSLLAERVTALFKGTDVTVDVMRRDALRKAGAGALLGVASGSVEEPAMITLRYSGGGKSSPTLALVGKGITFDTGGISIKPALGMEQMKYDMSGAAAVINAMAAIAELKIACNVVAVVPATENMPGGSAVKPGDVITAMDGTSIEVINTDAEGRLVLADGVSQARAMGATHIVDVATLTGAAVIALGHVTTALMSNDISLTADVVQAARPAGDRFTELPLYPEYDVCLKSDVADIKNWGGRENGTIAGALFIRTFTHGTPWVHLDIAGTAWNKQSSQTQIPSGPSGTPVRTLVELARIFAGR